MILASLQPLTFRMSGLHCFVSRPDNRIKSAVGGGLGWCLKCIMRSSTRPCGSPKDTSVQDDQEELDLEAGVLILSGDSLSALHHGASLAQGMKTSDVLVKMPLCHPPSTQRGKFKFFSPQNVLGQGHYKLRMDQAADSQHHHHRDQPWDPDPRWPSISCQHRPCFTGAHQEGSYLQLSHGFTCDITVGAHPHGPAYQDRPGASEDNKAVAVAANLQLIRRDVVLWQLLLQDDHVAKAKTAPFLGPNLVGPNIKETDAKIMPMWEQHSLHRGHTMHFKIPKKTAPRSVAQAKASVHERLGSLVHQEGQQSFRPGQQTRPNRDFCPSRNIQRGNPIDQHPNCRGETNPFTTKKKAEPPKAPCQWRDSGGGSPDWFCPVLVEPDWRMSVIQDPAIGCPSGVGIPTPLTRTPIQFSTCWRTEP